MNVLPCTYRLVGYLYFTYINPPGPRNGDLKLPVRRGVMSAVPNRHEGEEHLGRVCRMARGIQPPMEKL